MDLTNCFSSATDGRAVFFRVIAASSPPTRSGNVPRRFRGIPPEQLRKLYFVEKMRSGEEAKVQHRGYEYNFNHRSVASHCWLCGCCWSTRPARCCETLPNARLLCGDVSALMGCMCVCMYVCMYETMCYTARSSFDIAPRSGRGGSSAGDPFATTNDIDYVTPAAAEMHKTLQAKVRCWNEAAFVFTLCCI